MVIVFGMLDVVSSESVIHRKRIGCKGIKGVDESRRNLTLIYKSSLFVFLKR